MSVGHRGDEVELDEASSTSLYRILGESDTPALFARGFEIDFEHDLPCGGGSSLDRKRHYIDRTLYQEVMDGAYPVNNMRPIDVINAWLQHEHSEVCISDGDNPVDYYIACHRHALRWEHGFVKFLGAKVSQYEAIIWPGLEKCYAREPKKPPKDLWCGPHLNMPTERDEQLLRILTRLGVEDASKIDKYDAHYGFGQHECHKCRNFNKKKLSQLNGQLAPCKVVSGLVRDIRGCDYWIQSGEQ